LDRQSAMPRYCSRCKQHIDGNSRGPWPLRAMCVKCARTMLVTILALAACAGGGFVAGHYTRRPVNFTFIGTRVDPQLGSPVQPAQTGATAGPAAAAGSGATASVPDTAAVRPVGIGFGICGAPTKSGKPCQRRVRGGGYCWQHRDKVHG